MLLADTDIHTGHFIARGFDDNCLRGCTYEFRVSEIAYRYDYDARVSRQEISDSHVIHPFETKTIITVETVRMDQLHFMSLFSKGFLFSLGLVPVCTGADPGFEGRLGITLTNMSARNVVLPVNTRFVKGIIHQLNRQALRPYAGQHGDATQSWPYPAQFHAAIFSDSEYLANMNRFLPQSIVQAVTTSLQVSRSLHRLIWLLGFLAMVNIAAYFAAGLGHTTFWQQTLNVLNIVGALASIVALIMVALQQLRLLAIRKDI